MMLRNEKIVDRSATPSRPSVGSSPVPTPGSVKSEKNRRSSVVSSLKKLFKRRPSSASSIAPGGAQDVNPPIAQADDHELSPLSPAQKRYLEVIKDEESLLPLKKILHECGLDPKQVTLVLKDGRISSVDELCALTFEMWKDLAQKHEPLSVGMFEHMLAFNYGLKRRGVLKSVGMWMSCMKLWMAES